ncbi:MAG: hypothetical protein HYU99_11610 [Deltaproteobacteria bacterium]|nr:hypothetical protein [Deltaproteobacteria bacterium]
MPEKKLDRLAMIGIMEKSVELTNSFQKTLDMSARRTDEDYAWNVVIPALGQITDYLTVSTNDIEFCKIFYSLILAHTNAADESFNYSAGTVYYKNPALVEKTLLLFSVGDQKTLVLLISGGMESLEWESKNDSSFENKPPFEIQNARFKKLMQKYKITP